MSKGRSQFVGAAGQYYLAYSLAVRHINAGLTLGNAPGVDLLAAFSYGGNSISFQVKTSSNAYKAKIYGHEGYEWFVGVNAIDNYHQSFWYALIDLQENQGAWTPTVFFVPSRWVAEFVKPDWSRKMYFLPTSVDHLTSERWDLVEQFLSGEQSAIDWANDWPTDMLVQWGADS